MTKHYADLLEKLVAGAFVVAFFQGDASPAVIAAGLFLFGCWCMLRKRQLKQEQDKERRAEK